MEIKSMKGDIARIASLLKQALRSNFREGPSAQPKVAAQSIALYSIGAPKP